MLTAFPSTIKTVSDFQRQTKPTFDQIKKSAEPVLVMNRNKVVGVFLSDAVYAEFINAYREYRLSKESEIKIRVRMKKKKPYTNKFLDQLVGILDSKSPELTNFAQRVDEIYQED
ncbi:MAG TPA: hypothetical protein PKX78_02530 [Candidatus Woesebacteria bacterium]|nr:hypothetical protein [Candidatus Woesebacteria bacterium]